MIVKYETDMYESNVCTMNCVHAIKNSSASYQEQQHKTCNDIDSKVSTAYSGLDAYSILIAYSYFDAYSVLLPTAVSMPTAFRWPTAISTPTVPNTQTIK